MPLTLLPSLSRGGDQHMMPITFGTTRRIPPATPDLAGSPTWNRGTVKLRRSHQRAAVELSGRRRHWRGRRTAQRSRTCHRNAWGWGCFARPRGSARAPLWWDRSRRWPKSLPWHWRSHTSPRWSTTAKEYDYYWQLLLQHFIYINTLRYLKTWHLN